MSVVISPDSTAPIEITGYQYAVTLVQMFQGDGALSKVVLCAEELPAFLETLLQTKTALALNAEIQPVLQQALWAMLARQEQEARDA